MAFELSPYHYTLGNFVDYPPLVIYQNKVMECPCCNMQWSKKGGGLGFVKAGAISHVAHCYLKMLAEKGLRLADQYNMEKLGFEIIPLMDKYEEIKALFEKNKGKQVKTDNYDAVVCGYHISQDDSDSHKIIVALTKDKNGLKNGIRYRLPGDVFVTHENNQLAYDFIHIADLEKHGLKGREKRK